jgi:hypothetical protein
MEASIGLQPRALSFWYKVTLHNCTPLNNAQSGQMSPPPLSQDPFVCNVAIVGPVSGRFPRLHVVCKQTLY